MVRLGLVSEISKEGDIYYNLLQIRKRVAQAKKRGLDLLCFGEAYLHGFDGLEWIYPQDLSRALSQDGQIIHELRSLAREHGVALSLGYIEKEGEDIYSSNIFLSSGGEIVNNFRRLSPGWKIAEADRSHYREGEDFSVFTYQGKRFATAICGDLWYDEHLNRLKTLDFDYLLWPLYIDYSVEEWQIGVKQEYGKRLRELLVPTLMINSSSGNKKGARGGCYVFWRGQVLGELPLGQTGILEVNL